MLANGSGVRGPSPRARGADVGLVAGDGARGSIPACAGSSCRPCPRTWSSWVHPRVRGEQVRRSLWRWQPPGPSPRARGAELVQAFAQVAIGSIPACAGSRSPRTRARSGQRVHPRVRGEQSTGSPCPLNVKGPSPRARGADGKPHVDVAAAGSIPACAGSRRRDPVRASRARVHPRVRGEQLVRILVERIDVGPSPRARGAVRNDAASLGQTGSIPACAGSRARTASRSADDRVHPRVRGEQSIGRPAPDRR